MWYKKSKNIDLFSGNCGMYAIALGKIAQEQNKPVTMIVAANTNNLEELLYGEPTVYHIAVEIDGEIYDGRGKISLNDVAQFAYDIYGDSSPQISFLYLDESFIHFVRSQTNYDTSWENFYNDLKQANSRLRKIKTAQKNSFVYHNTKRELLPAIAQEGLTAGTFTYRPYSFTGDVWLATEKSNLKNIQEHQYGGDIAIESQWEDDFGEQFNIIPPEKLFLVDKKGKIITRMDQWGKNNVV